MEALDIVKDIGPSLGAGPVLPPIDSLTLEHAEEALYRALSAALPTALMLQTRL